MVLFSYCLLFSHCNFFQDDEIAVFDSNLGIPVCESVQAGGKCTSVGTGLHTCKWKNEPFGPTTIDGCNDGNQGEWGVSESIESITVSTTSGGMSAKIGADIISSNPNMIQIDFWYAAAPLSSPSAPLDWQHIK